MEQIHAFAQLPKINKPLKFLVLAIAATLSMVLIALTGQLSASALNGGDFRAGRIIDDSVFFNGNTASINDIQGFLNAKVPACDTWGTQMRGSQTRAQYGASVGNPAPYTCLRDYQQNTPSMGAENKLCSGIGGGTKSAAQIIHDVGAACGVNPLVLIILLQKEQSLITDDWPWPVQYTSATGFGCPDTAPCDAGYAGFFYQVYSAARQFKKYARDADQFGYRAYRNNFIQYNPVSSCNGTNVFIDNQATAGLYVYTPYQPNQAALNNLYGTGDACSAYGNRNFWRMFTEWFGNTTGPDYFGALLSRDIFTDSSYTKLQGSWHDDYFLAPGQKAYIRIKVTNNGRATWSNTNTRLGTYGPMDYQSALADNSWLSKNRIVGMKEATVAPGQTATFEFSITAPEQPGNYTETYAVITESIAWMDSTKASFAITVAKPYAASDLSVGDSTLPASRSFTAGKIIFSPERATALKLQPNGNLELFVNFQKAWQSNTTGTGGNNLILQSDGNLVLYAPQGPVWSSGTSGSGANNLSIQSDGNVVLYGPRGPVWSTATSSLNQNTMVNQKIGSNGTLLPGQSITSPDRKYRFILQEDGNLVLYSPYRALWGSGTSGRAASSLNVQPDGNFVLYNASGQPMWSSGTYGRSGAIIIAQPDANMVGYQFGQPVWSTGTYGKE